MSTNNIFGSRGRWGIGLAALVGITGSAGFMMTRGNADTRDVNAPAPAVAGLVKSTTLPERPVKLGELEDGFAAIADRFEPAVVSIRVKKSVGGSSQGPGLRLAPQGDEEEGFQPFLRRQRSTQTPPQISGIGSGVIVRNDGWILTNDHVVGGADKVLVKLHDGREFEGQVRRDYRSDLAVVKIDANNLPAAEFADSDKVRVGQWAIAFGSPLELEDSMTVGVISARARQKTIMEGGQVRFYPSLLQTDASINQGNSGGALVDIRGRIIGINVAIVSPNGGSVGLGFSIPANTAKNVMDQLITKGKVTRGYLGVLPRALTPADRDKLGVKAGGALIQQVTEGTPAAKAGMLDGDVVLKVNGQEVNSDLSFRDMIARIAPGQRLDMQIRRNGKEMNLVATVEAAPEVTDEQPAPVRPRP